MKARNAIVNGSIRLPNRCSSPDAYTLALACRRTNCTTDNRIPIAARRRLNRVRGVPAAEPMKHVPAIKDFVKPLGPYSHAVVANGFVFISGQTPLKPGGGPGEYAGPAIGDQVRQTVRNIETIVKDLGGTLEDIVKVTVFLANPADYKAMNEAYRESFPTDPPARSIARLGVEVPGLLISIDAIAVYAPHPRG